MTDQAAPGAQARPAAPPRAPRHSSWAVLAARFRLASRRDPLGFIAAVAALLLVLLALLAPLLPIAAPAA
ncbi:MAG TPA: hypothetical protein VK599_13590, partial [Streptosporangiaceae bacterium]|nr:hypothetical protein [Streptosporangiaceae bacterium]